MQSRPHRLAWVLALLCLEAACAAETENLNLESLPAPGRMKCDGSAGEWDLILTPDGRRLPGFTYAAKRS